MKKVHMRLSVQIEVTDEEFEYLRYKNKECGADCCDIEYDELPSGMRDTIAAGKFTASDWEDKGYIPGEWFQADWVIAGKE